MCQWGRRHGEEEQREEVLKMCGGALLLRSSCWRDRVEGGRRIESREREESGEGLKGDQRRGLLDGRKGSDD